MGLSFLLYFRIDSRRTATLAKFEAKTGRYSFRGGGTRGSAHINRCSLEPRRSSVGLGWEYEAIGGLVLLGLVPQRVGLGRLKRFFPEYPATRIRGWPSFWCNIWHQTTKVFLPS